jgi:predicted AlkP superfamily pyrophosphatase or phosphodiesterase
MLNSKDLVRVLLLVSFAAMASAAPRHTVIVLSLDGYRHDYLERPEGHNLKQLAAGGVRAKALKPVFPTKTFPNHYSIATGLYPDHHGILSNAFYDPVFKATFDLKDRTSVEDGRWWGGEPIWITAQRQQLTCATLYWPGSEAAISGVRPTSYLKFVPGVKPKVQIERTLALLDRPEKDRPDLILAYIAEPDNAAHKYGPSAPEVNNAIREVDACVEALAAGVAARKLTDRVDLLFVSDHGMAEVAPQRVIYLDDYVSLSDLHVVDWSPVTFILPNPGKDKQVYQKLKGKHPHFAIYRKGELPEHLHLRESRRIPPIVGIADEGWAVAKRNRKPTGKPGRQPDAGRLGSHGYDDSLQSMWGIFVATGPSFGHGVLTEPFANIHVYELLCRLLGIKPAPNDGKLAVTLPLLAPSPAPAH